MGKNKNKKKGDKQTTRPIHISIVYPSSDMLHAQFCGSLVSMVAYSQSLGIMVTAVNPRCSLVQIGRLIGVETSLKNKADKILFIDSDQTFPPDALARLIKAQKPIVGAASLTRAEPIRYTCKDENGERIDFSEKTGLQKVRTNGFPMTLIDSQVFKEIPKPWFEVTYNKETGIWTGEDEHFCHEARKLGYDIWIDADLKIGHLGTKEYK